MIFALFSFSIFNGKLREIAGTPSRTSRRGPGGGPMSYREEPPSFRGGDDDSNSNPDDDIDMMKENPNYVRKRNPINFTMQDLEGDQIEDETFQISIEPGSSSTSNL